MRILNIFLCVYWPLFIFFCELSVHISSYYEVVFGGQKMGYKRWSSPWLYFDDNNEIIAWKPYRKPEPYNQKEIMEVSNEKIQRKT